MYPALHRLEDRGWLASYWGCQREQPEGKVLQADGGGTQKADGRAQPVDSDGGGHWAGDARSGAMKRIDSQQLKAEWRAQRGCALQAQARGRESDENWAILSTTGEDAELEQEIEAHIVQERTTTWLANAARGGAETSVDQVLAAHATFGKICGNGIPLRFWTTPFAICALQCAHSREALRHSHCGACHGSRIGANTALFTVVRSVLLKPCRSKTPNGWRCCTSRAQMASHAYNVVAGGIFQQWQKQSRSFEQMALLGGTGYNLSGANGVLPEKVEGGKCTWNCSPRLVWSRLRARVHRRR